MDIIRRDILCFNCLGHHNVNPNTVAVTVTIVTAPVYAIVLPIPDKTKSSSSVTQGNTDTIAATDTALLTTLTANPPKAPNNYTYLLKTVVATVISMQTEVKAIILFYEASQRSLELADILLLKPHHKENIFSLFGSKTPLNKRMNVAEISIRTRDGNLLPISVLIVPSIAAPLRNPPQARVILLLAHPIMNTDNFKIALLIGTET